MSTDLRIYVIDTNIILNNYLAPFTLKNAHVILPQIVINELDRKKDYMENRSAAYNARAFCNRIKKLIKETGGCEYQINSTLKLTVLSTDIEQTSKDMNLLGLDPSKADSIIVSTAWRIAQTHTEEVTVLTNDTNMWLTCAAIGLNVEEHETQTNVKESQGFYTGVKTLTFDGNEVDEFYSGVLHLSESDYPGLYPNQILVLKSEGSKQSAIAMFNGYDRALKRLRDYKRLQFAGISPLNKEQGFAFELLDNDKISCTTLAGRAGTGKSIVALSYAIEGLNKQEFDKIIILKPIVPVGKDIGFLPGTMEEKLAPWMESFKDSLDIIFSQDTKGQTKDGQYLGENSYDYLMENGILEFLPLTFMRGRSIQRSLIILDEAQNTSIHEMKTLLTRVGEGSKIILLGDVGQIDAPWLNDQNNGLSYLIEKGAESELIGHITLIKSMRSPLADWASSNL